MSTVPAPDAAPEPPVSEVAEGAPDDLPAGEAEREAQQTVRAISRLEESN